MVSKQPEEGEGYDIVVWADEDGDIVCSGYTERGDKALKKLCGEYSSGTVMEILIPPTEFFRSMPKKLKLGLLNPETDKINKMQETLH